MRGELRLVVDRLVREVWLPLVEDHSERNQIAGGLFAAVMPFMIDRYTPELGDGMPDKPLQLRAAECADDYELAVAELETLAPDDFECEVRVVATVTAVRELLEEYDSGDDVLTYRSALSEFVDRYSLRYYVSPLCSLRVTLPGVATSTYHEFRKICELTDALRPQLDEFEHALAEAIDDPVQTRIKTALAKLFILMEGVAARHPDAQTVNDKTFGKLCQGIGVWPHAAVREAAENLYRFACDYPGIRHAGNVANMTRAIETQDLSALCTIMFGFTSYLSSDIPEGAGLRIERRIRQSAELKTVAAKPW